MCYLVKTNEELYVATLWRHYEQKLIRLSMTSASKSRHVVLTSKL